MQIKGDSKPQKRCSFGDHRKEIKEKIAPLEATKEDCHRFEGFIVANCEK